MYSYYNPNPKSRSVGDCVVRGISKATGKEWDEVFLALAIEGYIEKDMPSSNAVWGRYLRRLGYTRAVIPDRGTESCTVAEFAGEHPRGTYILALSGHVVAVKDGCYYDAWDSGNEVPVYFWYREDE